MQNKIDFPSIYTLYDLPQYKEFQELNKKNKIDGRQTAIMFGTAINWLSFLEVLWPPFDKIDLYSVGVTYLICNDERASEVPQAFYQQMALVLKMFWTIQLEKLYPEGGWEVEIDGWDDEITIYYEHKNVITLD